MIIVSSYTNVMTLRNLMLINLIKVRIENNDYISIKTRGLFFPILFLFLKLTKIW